MLRFDHVQRERAEELPSLASRRHSTTPFEGSVMSAAGDGSK